MKQGLQLSLGHQLKMTPQLQQAIKLLQLSTLDLQQEIQQNLYENPLLELDETAEAEEPPSAEALAEKEQREQQELEREFEYSNVEGVRKNQFEGAEFPDQEGVSTNSLRDHLEWQLNLSQMSDLDRAIGAVIIDSIGSDGFLSASLEELLDALKDDEAEEELDLDDIRAVLKRIQHFDPPGIGACDVRECLQIQLDLLDSNSEHMDLAKKIVAEYLPLLAKCDLATLAKRVRARRNICTARIGVNSLP